MRSEREPPDSQAAAPPDVALVDTKYYEVATPGSLAERLTARARDRIYADFLRLCRPAPEDTLLDVGVSDVVGDAANVLQRHYPYPERIISLGLGSGEAFRARYPTIRYQQIEANKRLPFSDRSVSVATANAVLEHVGSLARQRFFVAEMLRVAQRVFITVPNRFFPVEHHTGIAFLHWTDASFALACRAARKETWRREDDLVLMSRSRLRAVVPPGCRAQVGNTGLLLGPCSSNLFLLASHAGAMPAHGVVASRVA